MPFASTRPLSLRIAVCLAAAAIAMTDAQAAVRGGGGFRPQTFHAPVKPQTQFSRPPNQHLRRPQGLTHSDGGRHDHRCHTNCGSHPTNTNPGILQAHPPQPVFTQKPPLNALALKQGPGRLVTAGTFKPTFPAVSAHNKFWPILKGQKFIWLGGYKHFFIPVGLLGVVVIGDSYWYPDGYVSIAGPLCTGFTPDGCRLEWRLVNFEDGGSAPQCVQYCPEVGPPRAQAVTLPPPPALALNGQCQVTIYENPGFSGLSAPTSDNQPVLSETGWKDEISSIQVEAGTWDFFSNENFGGDSIRMASGSYPMLVPEWNKRIGSFMCVEPSAAGDPGRDRRAAPLELPQSTEPKITAVSQDEICKRDAAQLEHLRISQGRDEIIRFERELGCEKLRPQVIRLRESVDRQ